MNRIDHRFAELRAAGRVGLIPFITAGDPQPERTVAVMHALVAAGADLIELGVPFSDPMADGPVIQRASERALARGVGVRRVLEFVSEFRRRDTTTPVVLMGYLNPLEIHGHERFCRESTAAGVDGLLLVDLPVEEADLLAGLLQDHGLRQIFLTAPTTTDERLRRVAKSAQGFVYYVSFAGITGADRLALGDVGARVAGMRALMGDTPLAVGFGVKEPAQARAIAAFADAVVVGSALVETLEKASDPVEAATRFLAPLRAAIDQARAPHAA